MKHKPDLRDYGILVYIGPVENDKQEYWVTYAGLAHCQGKTGLPVGTLGKRHGHNFHAAVPGIQ